MPETVVSLGGEHMKIRHGFVTNSSSTSYCIVGISDEDLVEEIVDVIERVGSVLYADQKQSWWEAKEFAGRMGLQVVYGPYDSTMVGLNAEDALQDQSIYS